MVELVADMTDKLVNRNPMGNLEVIVVGILGKVATDIGAEFVVKFVRQSVVKSGVELVVECGLQFEVGFVV